MNPDHLPTRQERVWQSTWARCQSHVATLCVVWFSHDVFEQPTLYLEIQRRGYPVESIWCQQLPDVMPITEARMYAHHKLFMLAGSERRKEAA